MSELYTWIKGKGAASRTHFLRSDQGHEIAYIRDIGGDSFRFRGSIRISGSWRTEARFTRFKTAKDSLKADALEFLEIAEKADDGLLQLIGLYFGLKPMTASASAPSRPSDAQTLSGNADD